MVLAGAPPKNNALKYINVVFSCWDFQLKGRGSERLAQPSEGSAPGRNGNDWWEKERED